MSEYTLRSGKIENRLMFIIDTHLYHETGINIDSLVKSHEFNYRWLSKKVHIQGVVDGTFYDAINIIP